MSDTDYSESSVVDVTTDGSAGGDTGGDNAPASSPGPAPSGPIKYGDLQEPPQQQPERPAQPRTNTGQFGAKPKPPASWKADVAQHWGQLNPQVQEYIGQRELEMQRAISSQGERAKAYEPWDQAAQEYQEDLARHNLAPHDAFRMLMNAQRQFEQDPVQAAIAACQGYGIDLVGHIRSRFGSEMERTAHQTAAQQWQEHQTQTQMAEANALIQKFKESHPHFESVEQEIISLLPLIRQREPGLSHTEILTKAYESATLAHPETRQRVREEERKTEIEKQKAEEFKRIDELKKRAVAARAAAKLNVRSSSDVRPNPQTMEQTIEDIARRRYG